MGYRRTTRPTHQEKRARRERAWRRARRLAAKERAAARREGRAPDPRLLDPAQVRWAYGLVTS